MGSIKTILHHINTETIDVEHTTLSDTVMVSERFGCYLLEFAVTYDIIIKDYLPADYLQPEEGSISFINRDIDSVYVYKNNIEVELTEKQIEILTDALYIKLID